MIVKNYSDLQKALNWLDRQDEVAYDLETNGLSPRKNQVIGIAIGNETEAFYVVHQHLEDGEYKQYLSMKALAPLFQRLMKKKLITFNGSFDLRFTLHYFGIDLRPALWSEVQLARHTHDENLNPHNGLKDIALEMYGKEAIKEQQDLLESILANGGSKGQVWLGKLNLVGVYACQDVLLTARINKVFCDKIKEEGLWDFYQTEEVMPLYREVTIGMEDTGVKLDVPLMTKTREEISADIDALETRIRQMIAPYLENFEKWYLSKTVKPKTGGEFAQAAARYYGITLPKTATGAFSLSEKSMKTLDDCLFKRFIAGEERLPDEDIFAIQKQMKGNTNAFNLNSTHHWKHVFFKSLDEIPLSYTPETNAPQCDDEFLESVKDKYEFVPVLLDYNKLRKIRSTYIEKYLRDAEDGRFYPRFDQHKTISGRYGGDLQQLNRPIPKKDLDEGKVSPLVYKYNNLVRAFFITDDNRVFIDCDFNSLEPHVFASVSGDANLKRIFLEGLDFYSEIAIRTESIQGASARKTDPNYLGNIDPSRRQNAKEYSLGIPYGKSGYALALSLDIPIPRGEELHKNYLDAFPSLAQWMEDAKEQCLTKGFVKSRAGRVRHMPEAPVLYNTWGPVLLNPLQVYERWGANKAKHLQMKYLSGKLRNLVNNARNFQIQSLAATITNRSSIAVNRALKAEGIDGCVIAQIHDQLICSVPEQDGERAAKIVQRCMEETYKIDLPLKAPPALAHNFRDGH